MKPRLMRPMLTVLVSGALVAGGAVYGSPAFADPTDPIPESSTPPPPGSPSASPLPSSVGPSTPESPAPDPSFPEPSSPGETDPSATTPAPEPSTTTPSTNPSTPDTKGPTKGNFRLNHRAVWAGQTITFTQTAADVEDPTDADASLTRSVLWGDGTKTVLQPTATSVTKTYTRAGSFKVSVTVRDRAGNQFSTPAAARQTVAVTVAVGKVSLSKKAIYQGAPFAVKVAKVPVGTTSMRIDWSDGWASTHKVKIGSITSTLLYPWRWDAAAKKYVRVGSGRISGLRPIKISWGNGKGYSLPQAAGRINVLKDNWKPTLTLTKPASPNRASAWKTIRGTATDKGAGVYYVHATVLRVNASGQYFCLARNNKWKRYYSDSDVDRYCYSYGVRTKVTKGKWAIKLPAGITKNQGLLAVAWTRDAAGNYSERYREARITRS